jgi:hypothetical protein
MKKRFTPHTLSVFVTLLLVTIQIFSPFVVLAQSATLQAASVSEISGTNKPVDASELQGIAPQRPSIGSSITSGAKDALKNTANDTGQATGAAVGDAVNSAVGGGAAGGCVASLASDAVVFGTVTALTALLGAIGVPSSAPDSGLGSAFSSAKNFKDYLEKQCLDPAARAIYAKMLFKINDSVLKWGTTANRGGLLNGSTFISDVGSYFNAVAEESVGTFIARQDKNNIFAPDIKRRIIEQTRNPDNNYTSDLSDRILASACNTYIREQEAERLKSAGTKSSGFFNGINLFNTDSNSSFPSSVKQFNGSNNSGLQGLGAFKYLGTQKAYAQTNDPNAIVVNQNAVRAAGGTSRSLFGLDGVNTNTSDPNAIVINKNAMPGQTKPNPCNRKAVTAAEKLAVISEYSNGNSTLNISGADYFDILQAETEPKNNKSLALIFAKSENDRLKNQAIENEKISLTGSNNTGQRVCTKYLPLPADAAPGEKPSCAVDGWTTTVTPQIVNAQTETAHQTSNQILQKLASTATWRDLAQTIVTNLVTKLATQLINNPKGLLSFNGKDSNSSQGSFSQSVAELNQSGTSITELNTANTNTNAYVSVLKSDLDAITTLVDKIDQVKTTCSQLLSAYSAQSNAGGILAIKGISGVQNHECNIDQANLNYKDDPTAALRLTSNPIYIEVTQLDTLKQQLVQVTQAYTNAKNTLNTLEKTSADYANSKDVNKEINLSTKTSLALGQVPQDFDITQKQAQVTDIQSRISRMDTILQRLTQELATIKGVPSTQ